PLDRWTDFHGAVLHFILRVEDENVLAALVAQKGLVGNEDGRVGGADPQPDAHEQAGLERSRGVGKDTAQADGAGVGVNLVVHEIHRARVRELELTALVLVGQAHGHGEFQTDRLRTLARRGCAAQVQIGALVYVKIGVHRVFGDDRGEYGVVGGNE